MQAFLNYVKLYDFSLYEALMPHQDEFVQTVNLYSNLIFLTEDIRHNMIMNDIKKTMTNVKLILNNGEIDCHKSILSIMPYFKILFEDCEGDVIYLDASLESMTIIINALYFTFINLDSSNLMDVMILFDMFMYQRYTVQLTYHLYKNNIITFLLRHNNINQLLILELLLHHMLIDRKDDILIKKLINQFSSCEKYMFYFTHWTTIFTKEQQLNQIVIQEKYEMFNRSIIEPKIILKLLIDQFIHSDCYYDVYQLPDYYFTKENEDENYIIIKSYYPKFHYIRIEDTKYKNHSIHVNTNKIDLDLNRSLDYKIGSKFLFSMSSKLRQDIYEITDIHKIINNQLVPAKQLKFLENIKYQLTFNRPFLEDYDYSWTIEEIIETVII